MSHMSTTPEEAAPGEVTVDLELSHANVVDSDEDDKNLLQTADALPDALPELWGRAWLWQSRFFWLWVLSAIYTFWRNYGNKAWGAFAPSHLGFLWGASYCVFEVRRYDLALALACAGLGSFCFHGYQGSDAWNVGKYQIRQPFCSRFADETAAWGAGAYVLLVTLVTPLRTGAPLFLIDFVAGGGVALFGVFCYYSVEHGFGAGWHASWHMFIAGSVAFMATATLDQSRPHLFGLWRRRAMLGKPRTASPLETRLLKAVAAITTAIGSAILVKRIYDLNPH